MKAIRVALQLLCTGLAIGSIHFYMKTDNLFYAAQAFVDCIAVLTIDERDQPKTDHIRPKQTSEGRKA